MKIKLVLKIFLVVICLICSATYLYFDSQLCEYGHSRFCFGNPLPLDVEVDHFVGGEGKQFFLIDYHGFSIVGANNYFEVNGEQIGLNDLQKYCYNKNEIIAISKGDDDHTYYVQIQKHPDPDYRTNIKMIAGPKENMPDFSNMECVLTENVDSEMIVKRNRFELATIIVVLVTIIYYLLR